MGIGVSESGASRGIGNAQVPEFAFTAGQPPTDLAQAVGLAKLTEEHGDKLTPAGKSFGSVVGTVFFHGLLELKARNQLKQLGEDTRKILHGRASLVDRLFAKINLLQVSARRALFIFYPVAVFN